MDTSLICNKLLAATAASFPLLQTLRYEPVGGADNGVALMRHED